MLGYIGVIWGLTGISLLLGMAIFRLSPYMLEILGQSPTPLHWYHWLALLANILFMAYSEGYRGFQKNFSPRFAARLRHLKEHPTVLHVAFSPLFCMGYFYTTPKRQIATLVLTGAIILLILMVQFIAQPWRGILDSGVVVGLIWGLASVYWFCAQALFRNTLNHSPELPNKHSTRAQ